MGKTTAVFGPLLDEAQTLKRYIRLGADLIITDRPDVLWSVLAGSPMSSGKEKGE